MLQLKFLFLTVSTVLLFGAISSVSASDEDYSFLQRFQANFSSISNEVEHELQKKRELNGLLIREFNREILLEFGVMIPRMRTSHKEFLEYITNRDAVSNECREFVLYLAEQFMRFQQGDIQDCALLTYQLLETDALDRFLPYEHEFARENTRATFQVVQTLGRNQIFDVKALKYELQDELDYYVGLREFYRERLNEELDKHGDDAYFLINWLEDCIEYTFFWQDDDQEYLRGYLENDCKV